MEHLVRLVFRRKEKHFFFRSMFYLCLHINSKLCEIIAKNLRNHEKNCNHNKQYPTSNTNESIKYATKKTIKKKLLSRTIWTESGPFDKIADVWPYTNSQIPNSINWIKRRFIQKARLSINIIAWLLKILNSIWYLTFVKR